MKRNRLFPILLGLASMTLANAAPSYDLLIKQGTLYDGSGGPPYVADVAVNGQKIVAIGDFPRARGKREIEASGLAVTPGFINMLSWANESLLVDGRSMSDIVQGVTLEVMGEGSSMGPLNARMKVERKARQGDIHYEIQWTTLGEYLDFLVAKGISTNVASFVGATTIREHEIGSADRAPTAPELARMQALVRGAMREGALGLASALIYAPAFYSSTEELIALNQAVAEYGGLYISHLRSESGRLPEAVDELIRIARESGVPAEIYHLKMAGKANWGKFTSVVSKIEQARARGLRITADMYTYTAAATGLDAAMPPWVQEGGFDAWTQRLRDPEIRQRVAREMRSDTEQWENFYRLAGPEKMRLVGFKSAKLKALTGKTLAQIARMRGTPPAMTAMDLVVEDQSRISTIYFLMSEDNLRKQIALPWVSFGSDAASINPAGVFLKSSPHPRAYGNFSRLLARYVRDEHLLPLREAVRRLTALPAKNLGIRSRGQLKVGFFADLLLFDPAAIQDHASFTSPHHLSTGMREVFVNGVQVLDHGRHTGALPGMVVRGPGYRGDQRTNHGS